MYRFTPWACDWAKEPEPKIIANDWVQLLELLNKVWDLGFSFASRVFGRCVWIAESVSASVCEPCSRLLVAGRCRFKRHLMRTQYFYRPATVIVVKHLAEPWNKMKCFFLNTKKVKPSKFQIFSSDYPRFDGYLYKTCIQIETNIAYWALIEV